jgi:hypothetical protein
MNGFITTEMETEAGDWRVVARRQPKAPVGLWSVCRWPKAGPKIPPVGQILTTNGWESLLKQSGNVMYIGEQRLANLTKEL